MVARDLLGTILVRRKGRQVMAGVISETEAYGHVDDPASHAYRGMTQRNSIMFGPVGMSYVYFTYGMHYCFNATARDPENAGAGAVLLRGVVPIRGARAMRKNRGTDDARILTNGPAKLTQAMCISSDQYGEDLVKKTSTPYITGNPDYDVIRRKIVASQRIGIRKATDKLWNFKMMPQTWAE